MRYVSDGLLGPQKGQIFEKKKSLKIFSSETVCFMKLILCIHVPGISLYKKVVFFCSSQIKTLVAMATFIFHRHSKFSLGKSENLLFLQSHFYF